MEVWYLGVARPRGGAADARRLEEKGWSGFAMVDSQNLSGDVYVALAMAANATTRIGLGPGVTNPVTRQAATTAGAIASVQRVADGREPTGAIPRCVGRAAQRPSEMGSEGRERLKQIGESLWQCEVVERLYRSHILAHRAVRGGKSCSKGERDDGRINGDTQSRTHPVGCHAQRRLHAFPARSLRSRLAATPRLEAGSGRSASNPPPIR